MPALQTVILALQDKHPMLLQPTLQFTLKEAFGNEVTPAQIEEIFIGKCGRTACIHKADERLRNIETRKTYCVSCARRINEGSQAALGYDLIPWPKTPPSKETNAH